MRAVAVLALVLLAGAALAAATAVDADAAAGLLAHKPKRASGKVKPRMVRPSAIHPKARVHYDVAKGQHTATTAAATTATTAAGHPVLRAAVPNSSACAARQGACGDKAKCTGTLVTGLCSSVWVCCVPKAGAATPAPVVTPAGPTAASFSKAYLLGKIDPATHPDFQKVPGTSPVRYIRKDVWAAYTLMNNAARNELGVPLGVVSATRTFADQKVIWERKWSSDPLYKNVKPASARALAIMSYSSMPSTSQHHWGCTFDLVSVEPSYFRNDPTGKRIDAWLAANAARFGFCRPFSAKPPRVNGYNEEQWHVAYKPVLKPLLEAYRRSVSYADITGFSGSETAQAIGAIDKFVYGIADACLA